MGESLFRRNAVGNFGTVVKDRSKQLNQQQTLNGKSVQDRNPAYIILTGICNKCGGGGNMTIPEENATWDSLYSPSIKPPPILQDVSITFGGDYGLAQKITANIKCFDKSSFERVQDAFLLPGNYISGEFGYSTSKKWDVDESVHYIKGFRVAVFSFSAGDDGTWIGSFTAVAAGEGLKTIDMSQGIFGGSPVKYWIGKLLAIGVDREITVNSIAELIVSDYQRNGKDSKPSVDENNSGFVITSFAEYSKVSGDAGMVIYISDHLRNGLVDSLTDAVHWARGKVGLGNDVDDTNNEIYVTLGYVTDRIFNGMVKKSAETGTGEQDKKDFEKLKIKYHEEFSISKLPPNLESGDPKSILILGRRSKFEDRDNGKMVDFNELKGGSGADKVKAFVDGTLYLDKILIHRDVVLSALGSATTKVVNESESVDPKNSDDVVVNMIKFFDGIFSVIRACTGGALTLRLIFDPNDDKRETLYVVDQNYGGDSTISRFIFNPIDGDGSTRSCNISSNGGSAEYRTSMFLANSKKGDVAGKLRKCDGDIANCRNEKYGDAGVKYQNINGIQKPGSMRALNFNNKQIESYKSVMTDLYRYAPKSYTKTENINWPGMTIDLTINGAWGIIPGCAIATYQMPNSWLSNKIYFMVTEVTHNFNASDWSTNIRGIMSFYDNFEDVTLNKPG